MPRRRAPRNSKPSWPRLLLAVDFSPASRSAFEAARGLAKDLGAGIVLVHVTPKVLRKDPGPGRGPYLTPPEAALEDAVHLSAKWAEELREADIFVKALNPIGIPAPTIVEMATKHGCSAIVVGTHGRSTLKSFMVGSIAREIIRTSPLPVLIVPTQKRKKPKGPATTPSKVILAATDFSAESDLGFEAAVRLAKDLKCVVRALHVVPLAPSDVPFPLGYDDAVAMLDGQEESAFEILAQQASAARKHKVGVIPSVQMGHPSTAILTEARATGAVLLVLGTHGKGAASNFFLGSVAQAVVQSADCPVLVVPGKRKRRGNWRR